MVDFELTHLNAIGLVENFHVGEKFPESNHTPIHITLKVPHHEPTQEGAVFTLGYKIHVKKNAYMEQLSKELEETPYMQ